MQQQTPAFALICFLSGVTSINVPYSGIGPYVDTPDRNLRYGPHKYGFTNDTCFLACYAKYTLFSVQDGSQCFCDNDFEHATRNGSSDCGYNGGFWCNYIYTTNNYTSNNKYVLISSTKNWFDANDYCKQVHGTSLATITSDADLSIAYIMSRQITDLNEGLWIGYNDLNIEGKWSWIDGSVSNYNYSGFNQTGNGDCVEIIETTNNELIWTDSQCSNNRSFICNISLVTYIFISISTSTKLCISLIFTVHGESCIDLNGYAHRIHSLMYTATCTSPGFDVNVTYRYLTI